MCDLAVAAREARFAVSGVNLGPVLLDAERGAVAQPGAQGGVRDAGHRRLHRRRRGAARGLVNRVVDAERLDAEVERLAASIVAKPRVALALGKALFYRQLESRHRRGLRRRRPHDGLQHDGRHRRSKACRPSSTSASPTGAEVWQRAGGPTRRLRCRYERHAPHPRPPLPALARAHARARRGAARDEPAAHGHGRPARGRRHRRLRAGPEAAAADRCGRRLLLRRQRPRCVGGGGAEPDAAGWRGAGAGHRTFLRILGGPDRGAGPPRRAHALAPGSADRPRRGDAGAARGPPARDRRRLRGPHRHLQRHHQRPGRAARRHRRRRPPGACSSSTWWPRWRPSRSTWTRCAPTWRWARRRRG